MIVGLTKVIRNLLGTGTVRINYVAVEFVCTKRLYKLFLEVTINVFNASPGVTCAKLNLNDKKIRFS